jgi:hypothetical protein
MDIKETHFRDLTVNSEYVRRILKRIGSAPRIEAWMSASDSRLPLVAASVQHTSRCWICLGSCRSVLSVALSEGAVKAPFVCSFHWSSLVSLREACFAFTC